jgi:hypothetical protein
MEAGFLLFFPAAATALESCVFVMFFPNLSALPSLLLPAATSSSSSAALPQEEVTNAIMQ